MIITIPGEPVPKGRPRMTRAGHVYTPARTKQYEELVKQCWKEQSGEHLDGPIMAEIRAFFRIPNSSKNAVRKKMEAGEIRPTKRPDIDNLIKSVLDALNGCAYDDDAQVVSVHAEKLYGEPHVEIELKNLCDSLKKFDFTS